MLAGRRRILVADAALVLWVAVWIVFGIAVGREVSGLTSLSDTVVKAGAALDQTGRAIGDLRSLPLIGDRIGKVEDQARAAAVSAKRSGRSSRKNVEDLSVLLAVAIAIAPSVPAVAVYLPFRLAQRQLPGAPNA
jgi:hypothetical protein